MTADFFRGHFFYSIIAPRKAMEPEKKLYDIRSSASSFV